MDSAEHRWSGRCAKNFRGEMTRHIPDTRGSEPTAEGWLKQEARNPRIEPVTSSSLRVARPTLP